MTLSSQIDRARGTQYLNLIGFLDEAGSILLDGSHPAPAKGSIFNFKLNKK